MEWGGLREKGRSYGGEMGLEAERQGGAQTIGVSTLRAERQGAPFPGYLERLARPARPVQSSADAGRTGRGRTGVEGDSGVGINWAGGPKGGIPLVSQSRLDSH